MLYEKCIIKYADYFDVPTQIKRNTHIKIQVLYI